MDRPYHAAHACLRAEGGAVETRRAFGSLSLSVVADCNTENNDGVFALNVIREGLAQCQLTSSRSSIR